MMLPTTDGRLLKKRTTKEVPRLVTSPAMSNDSATGRRSFIHCSTSLS
jgi:hypothetical protein